MRKFQNAKRTFLTLGTTQSSIFLALTLTMSRHAVKVSNQEEGLDEYRRAVYINHVLFATYLFFVFCGGLSLKMNKYIIKSICDAFCQIKGLKRY